jgi:K+-sensing histidine kinase KdpD
MPTDPLASRLIRSASWKQAVVALSTVAGALWLELVVLRSAGTPWVTVAFLPAVAIAAMLGGAGAGLMATVLGALTADQVVITPGTAFWHSTAETVGLGLFTAGALTVTLVGNMPRGRPDVWRSSRRP